MSNEDKKLNLDDLNVSGGVSNEPETEKNDFNIGPPPPPPPPFHHMGGHHHGKHPKHHRHGDGWKDKPGFRPDTEVKADIAGPIGDATEGNGTNT